MKCSKYSIPYRNIITFAANLDKWNSDNWDNTMDKQSFLINGTIYPVP